jgi:uncharacterized protein (DUF488 family)
VIEAIRIYTIGFTKKPAAEFLTKLNEAEVARVLDVRLNNSSQLAGLTKRDDLEFFLKAIHGIEYAHLHDPAPTQDFLTAYKKEKGGWWVYEQKFLELIGGAASRGHCAQGIVRQRVLALQRRQARPMPSSAGGRVLGSELWKRRDRSLDLSKLVHA